MGELQHQIPSILIHQCTAQNGTVGMALHRRDRVQEKKSFQASLKGSDY
jgi:hypothetical protein